MMTEARRKGVNGVPFVVIDGKWAVSGGQTAEVYSQVSPGRRGLVIAAADGSRLWRMTDIQKAGIERSGCDDAQGDAAASVRGGVGGGIAGWRRCDNPGAVLQLDL